VLSDRGPVAVIERVMGRARIRFGFAFGVEDGDFALQPSFPILLSNAVTWLAGEGRRAFPREVRVGEVVVSRAAVPAGVREATVTTVRGDATSDEVVRVDRGVVRFQASRPGLVKVAAGPATEWLVVRPAASPDLEALPEASGPGLPERLPAWRNVPYAAVAGALVLLVLLAEWWLFQLQG
jgi:hypothetical protein